MNSFMSWIGGKKALRELILLRFPIYYERYIEVFGGGGWVLFAKPEGNDFEVYNDFNNILVNMRKRKAYGADRKPEICIELKNRL